MFKRKQKTSKLHSECKIISKEKHLHDKTAEERYKEYIANNYRYKILTPQEQAKQDKKLLIAELIKLPILTFGLIQIHLMSMGQSGSWSSVTNYILNEILSDDIISFFIKLFK